MEGIKRTKKAMGIVSALGVAATLTVLNVAEYNYITQLIPRYKDEGHIREYIEKDRGLQENILQDARYVLTRSFGQEIAILAAEKSDYKGTGKEEVKESHNLSSR